MVASYPDTSFLIALYIEEETTARAYRQIGGMTEPLAFTPFHRLELRTALRARVFRKESNLEQLRAALRQNEEDLAENILQHVALPWADALREAERLGEAHLEATGVRSGDLLHVASALVLGAREFLTFDQRQVKLARLAGLAVTF